MTLNLTIINRFGVWQASDHRLSKPDTTSIVDEFSVKHVILRCRDGSALLVYAGAGRVGNVDLSDWIREMLRGKSRTVDESMILIRERATQDLGLLLFRCRMAHMFSVGAYLAGRPWAIQIRNFNAKDGLFNAKDGLPPGPILDHFCTVAKQIDASGQLLIFGDGKAVRARDWQLLVEVSGRKPRRPRDFRDLLAAINRRSAATDAGKKSISPHCSTTYMPPAGEPFESEFHGTPGERRTLTVPVLLFGIDLTDSEKRHIEQWQSIQGELTADELKRSLEDLARDEEDLARDAVIPRNRLRPERPNK